MTPKMTSQDAAACLGISELDVRLILDKLDQPYVRLQNQTYFGHKAARALFNFKFKSQTFVFQIVKGGTGKTSLVHSLACRLSIYGLRVLCIDMDQQGNLTSAFNQDPEKVPVMIDVLVDKHNINDCILNVCPGIDLIPSRFENVMLDEAIYKKNLKIEEAYQIPLQGLKSKYDLIIMDCPPGLGQSVAACALAADYVIAPITPEKFALSGLELTCQSLEELQIVYGKTIPLRIVLNKFDMRTTMSQEAVNQLINYVPYKQKLLNCYIRQSQDFPNAIANNRSIFDILKNTNAKEDIDALAQEVLALNPFYTPINKINKTKAVSEVF